MKWEVVGDKDSLCCVFFAGFGFKTSVYKDFLPQNTLVVFDYSDFSNAKDLLHILKQKYFKLIAFSMGVCVANSLLNSLRENITHSYAINGTPLGIDKTMGIHPTLFTHTIKHFSQQAFVQNCFNANNMLDSNTMLHNNDTLLSELKSLQIFCKNQNLPPHTFIWDKAVIALKDYIFKPQAQNLAWSAYKELYDAYFENKKMFQICHIDAPHFIFKDNNAYKTVC